MDAGEHAPSILMGGESVTLRSASSALVLPMLSSVSSPSLTLSPLEPLLASELLSGTPPPSTLAMTPPPPPPWLGSLPRLALVLLLLWARLRLMTLVWLLTAPPPPLPVLLLLTVPTTMPTPRSATSAAAGFACIMGWAAACGLGVTARATGALLTWMPLAITGGATMTPPWLTREPCSM